jgi:uncharacterized membrane protein YkgB
MDGWQDLLAHAGPVQVMTIAGVIHQINVTTTRVMVRTLRSLNRSLQLLVKTTILLSGTITIMKRAAALILCG